MADDYRIEALTPDHFRELAPLMEDAFGGSAQGSLFDWKYLRNPAGQAIGFIARATDGELAAFYGMIPEIYRWGDTDHRIYQSCDTMTHSRHRRKGLFQKLALQTYAHGEEQDAGFFAIGFSGPMSTPGFIKMKWANPFDIRHRFKPSLLASLRLPARPGPAVQTALPENLPGLMARCDASRRHSKKLYREFVEWRLSNPSVAYRYLVDDDAYAIFKQTENFVYLLDFWEQSPGSGKRVMASVDREAGLPGSRGILTACQPGGSMDVMLRRYWFMSNPFNRGPASERTPFITYGKPPCPEAATSDGWDMTSLDFDSL